LASSVNSCSFSGFRYETQTTKKIWYERGSRSVQQLWRCIEWEVLIMYWILLDSWNKLRLHDPRHHQVFCCWVDEVSATGS
jgi:hypothetical protein